MKLFRCFCVGGAAAVVDIMHLVAAKIIATGCVFSLELCR